MVYFFLWLFQKRLEWKIQCKLYFQTRAQSHIDRRRLIVISLPDIRVVAYKRAVLGGIRF